MKYRLLVEILFAACFVWYCIIADPARNFIPFFSVKILFLSILWGVVVIISTANSMNLTDGVDSLASTLYIYALLFLAWCGVADLGFVVDIIFAVLGYLIFNWPPAKIIMGDVGALGLGGMLGAMFYKNGLELFLPFVCIAFVLETFSVILQIFFIRIRSRSLFKLAPLHHDFEKRGFSRTKILLIFNSISIIALLVCCSIKSWF